MAKVVYLRVDHFRNLVGEVAPVRTARDFRVKGLIFVFIMIALLALGTSMADSVSPAVIMKPENPTNADVISFQLDQIYDEVTIAQYRDGKYSSTSYRYNCDIVDNIRLLCGEYRFVVTCILNGVKLKAVEFNAVVTQATVKDDAANFTYELENEKATITGYTGSERAIIIPAEVDGCPVVKIADGAFTGHVNGLASVKLADGIKVIGNEAFSHNIYLTSIDLPDGLTEIRKDAFRSCMNLSSIDIPNSVRILGSHSFDNCDSLQSVHLSESLSSISSYCFYGCNKLDSINIPETVKMIGSYAFFYTSNLTSVDLPHGLEMIGSHAFQGSGIERIYLPETLISMGKEVFMSCKNLKGAIIPSSVTKIDGDPFKYLSLEQLTISPENQKYVIEQDLFMETESNTVIHVFSGEGDTVTIPEGVMHLGDCAGENSGAQYLSLPSTLKTIGDRCFNKSLQLREIRIPDGVTQIGSAFWGCTSVERIYIPESVTDIDVVAFGQCDNAVFICTGSNQDSYAYRYVQAMNKQEEEFEPSIIISADHTTAFAGEKVTWKVSLEGIRPSDTYFLKLQVYFESADGADDLIIFEDHDYGPFTEKDALPLSVTETVLYNGMYGAYVSCYFTSDDLEDEYNITEGGGEVTVSNSTRKPLQIEVEANTTEASGDDEVTWTITPSGGVPGYEMTVKLTSQVENNMDSASYPVEFFHSDGEPITYTHALLYGEGFRGNNDTEYFLRVTLTDSEGTSVYCSKGTVKYRDPVYRQFQADHSTYGDCSIGGKVGVDLPMFGGAPPYHDIQIAIKDIGNQKLATLIQESANEGDILHLEFSVPYEDYISDMYEIAVSLKDSNDFNWGMWMDSGRLVFVEPVGKLELDVKSSVSTAAYGESITWNIESRRMKYAISGDHYDDTAEYFITPCIRLKDGTVMELTDQVIYDEYVGMPVSVSVKSPAQGEVFLHILAKDSICSGLVYESDPVVVRDLFEDAISLPVNLRMIEEQAFEGNGFTAVKIPDGCLTLGSRAFADCEHLVAVYIPDSIQHIADDAIPAQVIVSAPVGSYALKWAEQHNYEVIQED